MKLVTKNNYKFATGMFWQIPDEGKTKVNVSKLIKDTGHNMMCQIKTLSPTWGFCRRDELLGEKRVASLGKFIIDVSGLSSEYANSIICYKFKNHDELDSNVDVSNDELYGYIVLLNGTICPDEGEYVSNFINIRESIISLAKKYEIETLYLPLDVATTFFSIFENLLIAINNDKLLLKIIHNLSQEQRNQLARLIDKLNQYPDKDYKQLLANLSNGFNLSYVDNAQLNIVQTRDINLSLLQSLIREPQFEQELKQYQDQDLRYLISNVITLIPTSDEIYWVNNKFRANYANALIKPIKYGVMQKGKLLALFFMGFILSYLVYKTFIYKEVILLPMIANKPVIPKAIAVSSQQLISNCLTNNDSFFSDLGIWALRNIKCNSLGASFTFDAEVDTTNSKFNHLIEEHIWDNKLGEAKLNGRVGIYSIKYTILANPSKLKIPKSQIEDALEQASLLNNFKLSLSKPNNTAKSISNPATKFSLISTVSPVYLLNKGILANIKLSEIIGVLDNTSGFYTWTLQGEF